jgi:hypothetical protein
MSTLDAGFTGYLQKAKSFRAGMERADTLCCGVIAGTITKSLHSGSKFVQTQGPAMPSLPVN